MNMSQLWTSIHQTTCRFFERTVLNTLITSPSIDQWRTLRRLEVPRQGYRWTRRMIVRGMACRSEYLHYGS